MDFSQAKGDARLLAAILQVAREECGHGSWEQLEPTLAASWERLRDARSPAWPDVAERVRLSCEQEGLLH